MDENQESVATPITATNSPSKPDPGANAGPEVMHEGAIEAGWEKLCTEWEDAEAQRRFIGLATGLGALPLAAARYRGALESEPEKAKLAQAGIDKILSVALSQIELNRSPERPPPRRALFLIALMLSASLIGVAMWVYTHGL